MKTLLSAAAALAFVATPAAAAQKIATYSGTIVSGIDQTGVFAAPGTNLAGFNYVATYKYDKTLGGEQDNPGGGERSYGGPEFAVIGNPIILASIIINGVTRSINGQTPFVTGSVFTTPVGNTPGEGYVEHQVSHDSNDGTTEVKNNFINYTSPTVAPASLDQNFGPVSVTHLDAYGYMKFSTKVGGVTTEFAEALLSNDGNVALATAMVYSVGDVPEPASWAMLIAGFGLTGAVMRRRRVTAAIA